MKHTEKEPLRKCRKCGIEARIPDHLDMFVNDVKAKYKKDNLCINCSKMYSRKRRKENPEVKKTETLKWRAANPEYFRKHHAENRKTTSYQVRSRVASSRKRSKEACTPHTITVEDVFAVDTDICPCCKKPQTWDPDADRDVTKNLDKVVPELGYVPGNIQILCGKCNRLKQEHTVETLRMLLTNIEKHIESNKECYDDNT